MKSLVLVLALFGAVAHADNQCAGVTSTDNAVDQKCSDDASKYLAKKLGVKASKVKFFNGAMVGDGAYSIEIDMYQVEGTEGLYKVELDAEMCSPRGLQFIN